MEPQINYGGYQPPNQMQGQKVYGRSRGLGMGCLGIVGTIILLVVLILVAIFFAYPALTPDKIRGDFMDMTIVPQKDGSQKLWILTDGSFNFIQTTKSPGSYSTGRKCYFCKTWTYIYDPANEKVTKKIKTTYEDIITQIQIVYHNGEVWVITGEYGQNEPKLDIYDAETAELKMDTKAFMSKYSQLSGGLAGIRYDEKENTLTFKTKDGREQVTYSLNNDKMYDDYRSLHEEEEKLTGDASVVVLSAENSSGPRKKAYIVSGDKGKLISNKTSLESYANNEKSLQFFTGATSKPLGDKIYLEGIIYYQDNDCAIIVYLDQLGRKSNRVMACIDLKTGKEKWTVQQEDLFKRMKIDEDKDSFSSLFFTKDKIKIKRAGNLVALELKGDGIMGFDYNTGKKLWTIDI
jgi:hypothetical protein